MNKPTAREAQAAYNRLEKATNNELAQVSKHVLGYDPWSLDAPKLILPSVTRARILLIFKTKLQKGEINFQKQE
jgi:hypothetical protein